MEEKDEMLIVCRKIAASLIRLRRQLREIADDVSQIRKRMVNIEKRINEKKN